jgi:hypothetical protein
MSGLTRKKIKVRSKSGKTFQRSVMVKAEAIGKRAGGKKLNSLNPWEGHHTENVRTDKSSLGDKARFYGSSGPGSSHSWLALAIGAQRQAIKAGYEHPRAHNIGERDAKGASSRREAGREASGRVQTVFGNYAHRPSIANNMMHTSSYNYSTSITRDFLEDHHGRDNVHEVYQDPRRHVRE